MTRNGTMEIVLTDDQAAIDRSVRRTCAGFGDNYWTDCKENRRFPEEHCQAMEKAGFLGITMPAGTRQLRPRRFDRRCGHHDARGEVERRRIFGGVGNPRSSKKRFLRPLIKGEQKACFGVTEPDAGLDTTSIKTFARRVDGGRPDHWVEDLDFDRATGPKNSYSRSDRGQGRRSPADRRSGGLRSIENRGPAHS